MPELTSGMNWADAADQERPSWADQVEEEEEETETGLPPAQITIDGDIKTVVEYKINDDGEKVKTTRKFKIETKRFSKAAARRKQLKKFGLSENDGPGPNRATTFVSEDIYMQFLNVRQDEIIQEQEDPTLSKLRQQLQYVNFFKALNGPSTNSRSATDDSKPDVVAPPSGDGKYVPPSRRSGATSVGQSMTSRNPRENEQSTIRVTNLSEETKESDLQDLFKPFGPVQRIFLAKDKHTQQSKGFAFITFYHKDDAAKAIKHLCGYGYDHLILNVEWAKPSTTSK